MTTTRQWQCACGAYNTWVEKQCEACGTQKGKALENPESREGKLCPVDDAPLDHRGWCARGAGFSVTSACPFVCPYCRTTLSWEGGCFSCHGAPSGKREDWSFPGDRYELERGHWVKFCGPRKACSKAENVAGIAAIRAILAEAPVMTDRPPRRDVTPTVDGVAVDARRAGVIGETDPHDSVSSVRR